MKQLAFIVFLVCILVILGHLAGCLSRGPRFVYRLQSGEEALNRHCED